MGGGVTDELAVWLNPDFETVRPLDSRDAVCCVLVKLCRVIDERDRLPFVDQIIDLL